MARGRPLKYPVGSEVYIQIFNSVGRGSTSTMAKAIIIGYGWQNTNEYLPSSLRFANISSAFRSEPGGKKIAVLAQPLNHGLTSNTIAVPVLINPSNIIDFWKNRPNADKLELLSLKKEKENQLTKTITNLIKVRYGFDLEVEVIYDTESLKNQTVSEDHLIKRIRLTPKNTYADQRLITSTIIMRDLMSLADFRDQDKSLPFITYGLETIEFVYETAISFMKKLQGLVKNEN